MSRGVTWGLKSSFRAYVAGSGSIGVTPPAALTNDGSFFFPLTDRRVGYDASTLTFDGAVAFSAHGGMLDVRLEHVTLRYLPNTIELAVRSMRRPDELVVIATLEPTNDSPILTAWLARKGASLLAGYYPEGIELDPVVLTV